jgi:AAA domain
VEKTVLDPGQIREHLDTWAKGTEQPDLAVEIVAAALKDYTFATPEGRAAGAAYIIDKAESYGLSVPDLSHGCEVLDTPPTTPSVAPPAKSASLTTAFKTMDAPQEILMRDVMVERLWPDKASGLLLGPDKSGKTFYALEEAICLASRQKVLGVFAVPTPRRVLYISEEDTHARLQRRVYDILEVHGSADPVAECKALMATGALTIYIGNQIRLDDESHMTKLEGVLRDAAIDVLYLDALGKMTKQQISHDHDAGRLVELFSRLEATGASLRIVHHTSKNKRHGWTPDTATVRDASGHHAFADWGRSSLLFSRRKAVEIAPKPHEVIEVPSLIRFEGSDGAPMVVGSMVQRHCNTSAPERESSRLMRLTFAEPSTGSVVGKQLDRRSMAQVIAVLADPATPRTTDAKTGLTGVPTVEVADRAGFGRTQAGKVKAVRYLDAAVQNQKAVMVAEAARGAKLWSAA